LSLYRLSETAAVRKRGDFATLVQADSYAMVSSKKKNFTAKHAALAARRIGVRTKRRPEQERPKKQAGRQEGQEAATAYGSTRGNLFLPFLPFLPSCLLLAALPSSENVPVPRQRRAQENIRDEESRCAFALKRN